jgi:DNA-binding XRE family transcriptional regulator
VAKKKKSSTPHNAALITGKVLKWARERLGKSQQNITDDLGSGIRAENIDDWEKEKARPDFKKALKLARPFTSLLDIFSFLNSCQRYSRSRSENGRQQAHQGIQSQSTSVVSQKLTA